MSQAARPVPQLTEKSTRFASSRLLGFAAILGAVIIWGPTYVATKIALQETSPYMLAFIRFLLATMMLLPVTVSALSKRNQLQLPMGRLAAMGLTGGACFFVFQNLSLVYITAYEASLVGAILPAVVALVSWLVLKEKLTSRQIGGIALAIAGVILISILGSSVREATLSILGYACLVASAVSWAFFTVIGRGIAGSVPSTVVSAFNVAFGALFLLPLALPELVSSGWPTLSPLTWAMLAYLGLAGSGLSFLFWNYGLKTVRAGEAGTFTNLGPFLGAYSAWAFLGEPITWAHLAGAVIVVCGVMLVTGQKTG